MRKFLILLLLIFNFKGTSAFSKNDLYEKIDLFGEVLENIQKDYVDDVNQSEIMDSAINGVLQSLDPYSAYMSPELFKEMQTDTRGEFGGLGIGYQCKTNIEGIQICNDGVGGATYLDGAFKYTKNFDHLSEWDLEDLIDEYEKA